MSKNSIVLAIAATLAAVLGSATAVSAIEYGADLVIPKEDGTWQVHVEGLTAGATVTVTLACAGDATVTLGTTTAESDGTIDEFYTLPAGTTSKVCSIQVVSGAISKSFAIGLPSTGASSLSSMAVAGGMIAAGGVVVAMSSLGRRRRAAQA